MNRTTLANGAAAILLAALYPICAAAQLVDERLRALESQNETLRQQLAGQQTTIHDLKRRLGEVRVDFVLGIKGLPQY